jgi:hypothetical protein
MEIPLLLLAILTEDVPNIYSVWIALITVATPIVGAIIFWVIQRKLGEIHTLVNGNLHTALRKVDELRAKLSVNGIDPDA